MILRLFIAVFVHFAFFVCFPYTGDMGIIYGLLSLLLWFGLIMFISMGLTALGGLFPIYIHLLVFGWLSQLIFGVVYWMFPKFTIDRPRRSENLGWWTYVLLNFGLLLRLVAEPLHTWSPSAATGWTLVLSALAQLAAGAAFVANSWPRVKER